MPAQQHTIRAGTPWPCCIRTLHQHTRGTVRIRPAYARIMSARFFNGGPIPHVFFVDLPLMGD